MHTDTAALINPSTSETVDTRSSSPETGWPMQSKQKSQISIATSIRKPPKHRPMKLYHDYQKRNSRILNPAELKAVPTPDWIERKPIEVDQKPIEGFDIISIHKKIEVCEHRIASGADQQYIHPAFAVKVAQDCKRLKLDSVEQSKVQSYGCVDVKQKTPAFWPARVWDREDTMMEQAESDNMAAVLLKETMGWSSRRAKCIPTSDTFMQWCKGKRDQVKVMVDPIYYGTDESDEDTDWNDMLE